MSNCMVTGISVTPYINNKVLRYSKYYLSNSNVTMLRLLLVTLISYLRHRKCFASPIWECNKKEICYLFVTQG